MHLWAYGSYGPPVLVFPTAAGFAHEWQAHGMIDALAPLLRAGRLKVYCPESNVGEAWTHRERPLAWRLERHRAYERFVIDVLVPWIRQDCRWPEARIHLAGSSLGGMYAALFALRFPELFPDAVCMSGRYLATALTHGEEHPELYFLNPLAFVPNLHGAELDRVRRTHLTLVCGQGRWEEGCIEETIALAEILAHKAIPHERDLWGFDVFHDWEWWRRQAVHHFGRRFGG
jgi:esterase/lipase superfamily enzyme